MAERSRLQLAAHSPSLWRGAKQGLLVQLQAPELGAVHQPPADVRQRVLQVRERCGDYEAGRELCNLQPNETSIIKLTKSDSFAVALTNSANNESGTRARTPTFSAYHSDPLACPAPSHYQGSFPPGR